MDKTTKPLTSGKQKADEPYPLTSLGIDTQTDEELKVEDKKRNQGMYITGSQGTGKSTFIEHVLYQDFVKNYAVIAIDPHGQLIDHLIASMPEHRLKDAYVLDMTDSEYAFGLNLFYCEHYDDPIERAIVIDQVEHIFEKIFADTPKGLLLPKVLRNITLTFLEHQGMTLTDVDNLLHNDAFRKKLTDQLKNPDVKRYWQQYDSMRPNRRERETEGIDNRLPTFLTAPFVKHIIGQPTSRLDVRKAILNHEILLIKLPMKRLLYTAGIIGTILLAYIHQATFSFENMKEEERPGFTLVVDEFQNFSTPDFAELFKEGRKYGARTFVANQDRHDLSDVNRRATLQAYTVLSFRTTPEDASDLAGKFIETTPKLHPEDIYPDVLKHLPEHQNPDVVSFYETYVRKLQRAAEERTRRYHYKNDEDEIIYPRYDFGAGTVSYDEREVQETLDLLNTLFLEAQKKDAVNERLKTGLIRQVSPFLDFVDYYNCLYCGECTSFEPKAKKDVEDVIRTYEECTGSLEAFQGTNDDLLRFSIVRRITTFDPHQEYPYPIENIRPSLAQQGPEHRYYTAIFGSYAHDHVHRKQQPIIVLGDINLSVNQIVSRMLTECQELLDRYLTPQSYVTYLMETFKYYIDHYIDNFYQMRLQQPQQQKRFFWQRTPQQRTEEFPKEWYEQTWGIYQSGYQSYYFPPNPTTIYHPFGIGSPTIVEWIRGLASPEAFVKLMAKYGQKECKSKFGETAEAIWQTIIKICDERRSFYETRNTLEKLLVAAQQELESEIAYINKLVQPVRTKRDEQLAASQKEKTLRKAQEKARHDAFEKSLDNALAALIQDKLGKKKNTTEREMKDAILNLADYHALVRLGANTYTIKIKRPPKPVPANIIDQRMDEIQQRTHAKYCRLRVEIEAELADTQAIEPLQSDNLEKLASSQPDLALAKVRMNIEKLIKALYAKSAPTNAKSGRPGLTAMVHRLRKQDIIDESLTTTLLEIIETANHVIHSEAVEPEQASRAIDLSQDVIEALTRILQPNVDKGTWSRFEPLE